ncbi:MAG: superoxide dismutase family protein [Novosphingobium sp.]
MLHITRLPPMLVATAMLSACATVHDAEHPPVAVAQLLRADGTMVGAARVWQKGDGLVLNVTAEGLTPGLHGLHLHTIGSCDPPDFVSAGGHWNPTAHMHGSANPAGPHAGDVPNLLIGSSGRGTLDVHLNDQAAAGGGVSGLFDADGTAIVIHAGPDDMRSDPSGNSGGRIACGVLVRG